MLILLLAATLIGGGIGFEVGGQYGWFWALIGSQLGATAGALVVAAVASRR